MGVPTHFDGILGSKKMRGKDLSFLKVAFVGGDKIKEDAEERINDFLMKHSCNIKISKGYSLTEASATAAFASRDCNKLGSIGTPLAKTVVSAFEDTLDKEMRYEEIGKLFICLPTIMMGYYANEDETMYVINIDKAGNRWLYTGDLGYVDEDGCVYVIGREKRIIIRHDGFKVFPNVIERAVEEIAEIKECTVVGADDSDHSQGKVPIAFIVLY